MGVIGEETTESDDCDLLVTIQRPDGMAVAAGDGHRHKGHEVDLQCIRQTATGSSGLVTSPPELSDRFTDQRVI